MGVVHLSQIKLFGTTRSKGRAAPGGQGAKRKKQRSPLKILLIILIVLAALEALYFTCIYSNIPFIAKWRDIYIHTAMETMNHQWLATAFIPQSVIDAAMGDQSQQIQAQVGKESTWGGEQPPEEAPQKPQTPTVQKPDEPETNPGEEQFYELFWELDRRSVEAYLKQNPDALADGWEKLYINEAGLDDEGTSIRTTLDEQVLAVDVPNQLLLVRVEGDGYQGVLAVAKDPARLSVQNASTLGSVGQVAGRIANDNNGVLSMTASTFIDQDGKGNGGVLAGYAMSDGEGIGQHMGWGHKRLELRRDDRMYIVDVGSPVHENTRDAVEFMPALIIDGEMLTSDPGFSLYSGTNPRSVIGQSEKGEALMLVIEGRLPGRSLGTSVKECAEILQRHACMQAMNLDGGTSAIMWYDGEYVTKCSNTATPEGRYLPNAFVYKRAGN